MHHQTVMKTTLFRRHRMSFILLLVLLLSLLLAGCKPSISAGGTDDGNPTPAASESGEPVQSDPVESSDPQPTQSASPETEPVTETTTAPETEPQPQVQDPPSEEAPVIALTFDDGPSLQDTEGLLDLLASEQVPATFFVLGSQIASGREHIVKRAYDEGHEIASHGYSHAILTEVDAATIRSELEQTGQLIEQVTGHAPTLMRPPTGAYNDQVVSIAAEYNLAVVNWSWQSTPQDWNYHDNPDAISSHVIETAANGHIILLHDTNNATVASMADMIAGLKARGFRFMTVSQLLAYAEDSAPQAGVVYTHLVMPTTEG